MGRIYIEAENTDPGSGAEGYDAMLKETVTPHRPSSTQPISTEQGAK